MEDTYLDFRGPSAPRKNATHPQDYHRVNTYFVSLDKVVTELQSRFSNTGTDVLCALSAIVLGQNVTDDQYRIVSEKYHFDEMLLKSEVSIFYHEREEMNSVSDVLECLKARKDSAAKLHLFSSMVKILASIPATSCSAERSFSCLRRMKTYLRSTMGEVRLRSLSVLNIERQYAIDCVSENIDRVIDVFGSSPGRQHTFF